MIRIALITLVISIASSGFAEAQTPNARRRDSRLNGFLIGLVAGAVPGVMLGMGIKRYCENESASCPAAPIIVGGLTGLAGGGIGYAIDGAIHKQALTFGRPRPSPSLRFSFRF